MNVARRAAFLDRDGTINIEKDYLHRIDDFVFIEGAPQAIKRLNDAGILVIVVTNQSGIGRSYFKLQDVEDLHDHIQRELSALGASVDGFYLCPHLPTADNGQSLAKCTCRKGEPGMLLQAAEEFGVDLPSSWMVGDKLADVEAGVCAGCRPILVKTGYGSTEQARLGPFQSETTVVADLAAAVDLILQSLDGRKLNGLFHEKF